MDRRHLVMIVIAGWALGGNASRALAQNHTSPVPPPPAALAESPSTPPLPAVPKKPDPVLCLPAMAGDMQRVTALLRAGAEVNAADEIGRTALMMALAHYYPEHGAPKEAVSPGGEAQRQVRKLKIARLLIKRGADIKRTSTIGMTALHYAVILPDEAAALQFARELITAGSPIDARMGTGVTPLRMVVDRGRVAIARLLIEAGGNPGAPDDEGKTPLARAQALGPRELVTALTAPVAASPPASSSPSVAAPSPTATGHAAPAKPVL